MNLPPNDHLDRLLRDWAAREEPPPAHLEALCRAIADGAEELQAGERSPVTTSGGEARVRNAPRTRPAEMRPAGWSGRLAWFGLGIVATVAVAVLLLGVPGGRDPGSGPRRPWAGVPPEARLDRHQLAMRARLFAEVKRVFSDQLAWMAEAEGNVVLGLEGGAPASAENGSPIAVRLVIAARGPGEVRWRRCWSVDCIVRDEQFVEFGPEDGSKHPLALWVHRLGDGMIAIDTSLGRAASPHRSSWHSSVQRPGVPHHVFDFHRDRTQYRVFQTAASLPKEVG